MNELDFADQNFNEFIFYYVMGHVHAPKVENEVR